MARVKKPRKVRKKRSKKQRVVKTKTTRQQARAMTTNKRVPRKLGRVVRRRSSHGSRERVYEGDPEYGLTTTTTTTYTLTTTSTTSTTTTTTTTLTTTSTTTTTTSTTTTTTTTLAPTTTTTTSILTTTTTTTTTLPQTTTTTTTTEPLETHRWDSTNKGPNQVLSNGDMTVTGGVSVAFETCRATVGRNTGKYYYEIEIAMAAGDEYIGAGIAEDDHALDNWLGSSNSGWSVFTGAGGTTARYYNGGGVYDQVNSMTLADGDVVMIAVKLGDPGDMWLGKNGVWYGPVGDNPNPGIEQDPSFINLTDSGGSSGLLFPACSTRESTNSLTLVVKDSELNYRPPIGFQAWAGDGVPTATTTTTTTLPPTTTSTTSTTTTTTTTTSTTTTTTTTEDLGGPDFSSYDGTENVYTVGAINLSSGAGIPGIANVPDTDDRAITTWHNSSIQQVRTFDWDNGAETWSENAAATVYTNTSDLDGYPEVFIGPGNVGLAVVTYADGANRYKRLTGLQVNANGTVTVRNSIDAAQEVGGQNAANYCGFKVIGSSAPYTLLLAYTDDTTNVYLEMYTVSANGTLTKYSTVDASFAIDGSPGFCGAIELLTSTKAVMFYPNVEGGDPDNVQYRYITISGTELSVSAEKDAGTDYDVSYRRMGAAMVGDYLVCAYASAENPELRIATFTYDTGLETVTHVDEVGAPTAGARNWNVQTPGPPVVLPINNDEFFVGVNLYDSSGEVPAYYKYSRAIKLSLDGSGNITVDVEDVDNLNPTTAEPYSYFCQIQEGRWIAAQEQSDDLNIELIRLYAETTTSTTTTTTTTTASLWDDYTDTNYWTAGPNTTWTGSQWDESGPPQSMRVNHTGTWNEGYEPSKCRITGAFGGAATITIRDSGNNVIGSAAAAAQVEIDCDFGTGQGDIDHILLYGMDNVTAIEFQD